MLAQRVSRGVLSVGVWTVTKVLVSALATPFLSRGLGTAGYGLYAYYFSVMFIAAPLASAGVFQTMAKMISEDTDPARRSRVATLSALLSIAGVVVVTLLLVPLVVLNAPVPSPWVFAGILLGSIAFDVLWYYARGILYGLQHEELAGIPGSIAAVLGSLTSVVLVLTGYGLLGALAGVLLGNAVMAVVAARSGLARCRPAPVHEALSSRDPRPRVLTGFALTTMLYTATAMVLYKSGVVLVRHLTGSDEQTGLFATALQMAEFVWVLIIPVEGVMLQTTARMWREERTEEITALISRVVRYMALVAAFCLTVVFVCAEDAIGLYFGQRFAPASDVLRLVIPGVYAFSIARMLGPVLYAQGKVRALSVVIGGATLLAIVLNVLLVPPWGITGAGIATAVAYGVILLPYAMLLRSSGVHPLRGFQPLRQLLLVGISGGVMAGIVLMLESPVARLVTASVSGVVVFLVGALRLRLVVAEEIELIANSLPGKFRAMSLATIGFVRPLLNRVQAARGDAGGA